MEKDVNARLAEAEAEVFEDMIPTEGDEAFIHEMEDQSENEPEEADVKEEEEEPIEEEEEETVEEETDETTEAAPTTETPTPVTTGTTVGVTQPPDKNKTENVLENEPYDFSRCTVQVMMSLLPDDGGAGGRGVMIGVRAHNSQPRMKFVRISELEPIPPALHDLLMQLKNDLPEMGIQAATKKTTPAKTVTPTPVRPVTPAKKEPEKPKSENLDMFAAFNMK